MDKKAYYIRHRIYVNYSKKANRNYPRRLSRNLYNLSQNISPILSSELGTIKSKTFIPKTLQHVGPKYYWLISYLSDYFECLTIWETKMIKGSIKPINTFTVVGYEPDVLLAFHYITKIINSLDAMRFNMQIEFRRLKINKRRRGTNIKEKDTATTKSSKFFYKSLDNIALVIKEILEKREFNPDRDQKRSEIFKYLKQNKSLNFKAYNLKTPPKLKHCVSREERFQNKRILTVFY